MYCFIILFYVNSVIPSVTGQNHLNSNICTLYIVLFMFLKGIYLFYTLLYSYGAFYYFCHHGRPASKIFNPLFSFDYYNPPIILIRKNCALGILRFGLGPKKPRLVILGTLVSCLGTNIINMLDTYIIGL